MLNSVSKNKTIINTESEISWRGQLSELLHLDFFLTQQLTQLGEDKDAHDSENNNRGHRTKVSIETSMIFQKAIITYLSPLYLRVTGYAKRSAMRNHLFIFLVIGILLYV